MPSRERAFVRFATRLALGGQPQPDTDGVVTGLDWARVLSIAERQRVSGLLAAALRICGRGSVPTAIRSRLDQEEFAIAARALAVIADSGATIALLERTGVRALVAPAPGFCLRSADIFGAELRHVRVLVGERDAASASSLLEAQGYTSTFRHEADGRLVSSERGRPDVVLQTSLASPPSAALPIPVTSWMTSATEPGVELDGLRTVPAGACLFSLAARAAARGWVRLDEIAAMSVMAGAAGAWTAAMNLAERTDMRRTVLVAALLIRDVLGIENEAYETAARDPYARALADAADDERHEQPLSRIVTPPQQKPRTTGIAQGPLPRRLILRQGQSPGDIVMLTAAVRELHQSYPEQFVTDVRTPCPDLWLHNPYITRLDEQDPDVEIVDCEYPLIHRSNQTPVHFVHGFIEFLNERLGLRISPSAVKGDLWLSDAERRRPSPVAELTGCDLPYWIVAAGGKFDFTIKWWSRDRYQGVVDRYRDRLLFVQVGEAGHHHPALHGVLDLRGQTSLRDLIRLVHHADGVIGPVSLLMHLAAAVETPAHAPSPRPSVVIAGGREPMHWEAYPGHRFLHTIGTLPCCATGGCWRSRTTRIGDGDAKDHADELCVDVVDALPHCMALITVDDVAQAIDGYLLGGTRQLSGPLPGDLTRRLTSPPPAELAAHVVAEGALTTLNDRHSHESHGSHVG